MGMAGCDNCGHSTIFNRKRCVHCGRMVCNDCEASPGSFCNHGNPENTKSFDEIEHSLQVLKRY